MSARQFWCRECRTWRPVGREQTTTGARREHAREHTAEAQMAAHPDLVELGVQLDSWYGDAR